MSDEIDEPILISKGELENNRDNFKASIQQIIDQISQRQNDIVAEAEIDEDLLTSFGVICSQAITGEDQNQAFPIDLFKTVSFNGSPEEDNLCKINIQEYLKEKIAKGIDTNRAINEEDWLKESTKDSVEVNIFRELLRYKTTNSKVYTNAENNILDISELGKTINDPVLFSGSSELNSLLREARYEQELANKYDISFIDGYGRNYLCHVGNIIVFSIHFSDVNFSLLTTKNIFQSIEFGKVMDRQFVKVEYEPSEENENVGVLSINYWMDITLTEGLPCIETEIKSIE
ncbi:hypothetical protein KUL42_08920 [Alteromonas sp. KUL42]|uniref:hypothetical protein n=1 Tax=Alteromonas sp. KUL42 TaxID=2480797 RepID=UPI0010FFACDB|nr:hypothetical protein [Alteromonas sp. KUL42]GEA06131.1 hypothetical protein KUL42_08920 [Alteromonas sp. KUL42]